MARWYISSPTTCNFTIHVGVDSGQPLRSFRVVHQCLSKNSESWKRDIRTARDQGDDQFWYNVDSPEAFEIILNVVHGRPDANAEEVTRETLYKVAQTSARHGVIHMLRDFVRARSSVLMKEPAFGSSKYARTANLEQRVITSWLFSLDVPFEKSVTELINTTILGIDSQVVLFPGSKHTRPRFRPGQTTGMSLVHIRLPDQHQSKVTEEVEHHAAIRKAELDAVAEKLLEELESGAVEYCVVRRSIASEKCHNAMVGSIRRGMRVQHSEELTLEKYAQHLKSIEIIPSHATHARCVDALNWEARITQVYERKFGWSDVFLKQFPKLKLKSSDTPLMIQGKKYDFQDVEDSGDPERHEGSPRLRLIRPRWR